MNPPREASDSSGDDVARLLTAAPADAPDAAVAGSLIELQAQVERAELARTRWVAALDGRTIYAGDGARTPGVWLSEHLGLARAHASALVRDGRALRHCPATEEAWEAGRIGAAKARPLLSARDVHPRLFAEHEAGLVEAIAPLSVPHAVIVVNRWKACAADLLDHERHAADCPNRNRDLERHGDEGDGEGDGTPCGEGCGHQPDPAHANRFHLSRTLGGRRVGDLDLDAVGGAALEAAIDAWIDARWRDGTFTTDDGLTLSHRRALALIDLCTGHLPAAVEDEIEPDGTAGANADAAADTRAAPSTRSSHGEPRPSVSLLLDGGTLLGRPIEDLDDLLARRCELADGTPVPLPTAQRLLCSARVHQFLVRIAADGAIETVGVADRLRDATRNQRRALRLRDRGCVFPGCTVPFERCQIHHLTPYELDGPTLTENLVAICSHHHHLVHEGRWRLWRTPDAQLHLIKPDRTYVPVVGHGHAPLPDRPPGTGPPPPPPLPVHHRPARRATPPSSPSPPGSPGADP